MGAARGKIFLILSTSHLYYFFLKFYEIILQILKTTNIGKSSPSPLSAIIQDIQIPIIRR